MHILVTGGTGYIGSHTVVELLLHNHTVTIVDNLSNSSTHVIDRIEQITHIRPAFHCFNVEDKQKIDSLFSRESFDAVIHFAGLKAVGESIEIPLLYYRSNLDSTLSLLEAMDKHDVRKLVFSSSATVYGSAEVPYTEDQPAGQGITNPYGQTKYFIEQILRDTAKANNRNEFTILRYFNPIGAHESGLIGELPQGTPNNLMPYIVQVAAGKSESLRIFGDDYNTVDGTGVRDYIHVMDLASGHLAALAQNAPGISVYNLGTGKGTSVLELINAFEAATKRKVTFKVVARRPGDLAEYYADVSRAQKELGWKTKRTVADACRDSWKWQSNNPSGY